MLKKLAVALLASLTLLAAPLASQEPSAPPSACDPSCTAIDMQEMAPTSLHETIWRMMEQCSGRRADFDAIRWYVAAAILPGRPVSGKRIAGLYSGGRILLNREYAFDGTTVSHEILHAIFNGPVPMDIANSCVLRWEILVRRTPPPGL